MASFYSWALRLLQMANGDKINVRRHAIPHVETYEITADELSRIETEAIATAQDFQYCSIALTVAISFSIALFATEIKSERTFEVFTIMAICGFVFALYFGQSHMRGKTRTKSVIQSIRERQIGPIGEEGHELKPAQVAQLPPVPAPQAEGPLTRPAEEAALGAQAQAGNRN